jgi:hypothetical protein
MGGFLPVGRLEGDRIVQILSAINYWFLGANFRYKANQVNEK